MTLESVMRILLAIRNRPEELVGLVSRDDWMRLRGEIASDLRDRGEPLLEANWITARNFMFRGMPILMTARDCDGMLEIATARDCGIKEPVSRRYIAEYQ